MKFGLKVGEAVTIGGVELRAVKSETHSEGNNPPAVLTTFEVDDDKAGEVSGGSAVPQ